MSEKAALDLLRRFEDDVRAVLEDVAWPPESRDEAAAVLLGHAGDQLVARETMDLSEPLLRTVGRSADPMMALRNWDRYIRASFNRAGLMRLLAGSDDLLDFLSGLFAMSQFFSDIAIRNPEYVEWCLGEAILECEKEIGKYREHLESFVRPFRTREARRRALARFRRRELLRIGVRECRGRGTIREYCRELSRVAQVACELAYRDCLEEAEAKHGLPVRQDAPEGDGRATFAIVAMGKFGSEELNFSSDIDLVFVYDEEGRTPGRADSTGYVTGSVPSHEFYCLIAREICNYLNDPTSEGVLYRVDARLRPEGKSGVMARSMAGYSIYFADQARSWEKIAYLKARCVTGDEKLGGDFEALARSFVYTGNRHEILLPEVARLKKRIDDNAISSDRGTRDVKRGPGGIREIEFFVSALQLLHGGTQPAFRIRSTIEALHALAEAGLIERAAATRFEESYWMLRRVEHALQMLDDQQTHTIPADLAEVHSLAVRCGFADAEDFSRELTRTRRWIRERFDELFREDAGSQADNLVEHLESGAMPDGDVFERLAPYGLGTLEGHTALRELCVGTREIAVSSRGQRLFEKLLPALLEELRTVADPTQAVLQLSHFLRSHHAVTPLYQLLLDHRPVLRLLLHLLGFGSMTPRTMVSHPGRFDQMLEGDALSPDRPPAEPHGNEERDESDAMKSLRRFKDRESLFIQAREIVGIDDAEKASARTTKLAESCLGELARILAGRHGIGGDWSVIAFGSFGAGDVHVCADLDLAFFCGTEGEEAPPAGLQNFAGDLLAELSAVTPEGRLWKMDARLRPDGASGALVVTLKRARRYYESEAGVWEFQSAMRARHVAGSPSISARALDLVRDAWQKRRGGIDVRAEIATMRGRMESSVRLPSAAAFDLKHGPGGLVDVEFLVQYHQLANPELAGTIWTPSVSEALPRLAEAGVIDGDARDLLLEHLGTLRTIQRLLRLLFETSRDHVPREGAKRAQLVRAITPRVGDGESVLALLPGRMETVRELFDETLGR